MKPTSLPPGSENVWQSWPQLETLQAQAGLSITKLRAKLVDVPCYRGPDKSVRYEPDAARAALFGGVEEDDLQEDESAPEAAAPINNSAGLLREATNMLADTRKFLADVVRVMLEPQREGNRMMAEANSTQAKRLEHMEQIWDRMLKVVEEMNAAQAARLAEERAAERSAELKKRTFELVKENLPMLLSKWALTTEAGMALEFLASLDPLIVDSVIETGVLDEKQTATLQKLRVQLAARQAKAAKGQPQQEPAAQSDANHAAS